MIYATSAVLHLPNQRFLQATLVWICSP